MQHCPSLVSKTSCIYNRTISITFIFILHILFLMAAKKNSKISLSLDSGLL